MSTISELISKESIDNLFASAQESILILQEQASTDQVKAARIRDKDFSVGEPLIRYVHSRMLLKAQARTGLFPPYTHIYKGTLSDIIREVSEGTLSHESVQNLSGQIAMVLRINKLAVRQKGGTNKIYFLRYWPADVRIDDFNMTRLSRRDEGFILQQMERFEQVQEKQYITKTYDISKIPLPDPNPEDVMLYLKKVVECFNKMKSNYEEQQSLLLEIMQERDALVERLEAIDSEDLWSGTIDQISAIVSGS